jgi:hypothetical protein
MDQHQPWSGPAAGSPAEEVADFAAQGNQAGQHPLIDICLSQAGRVGCRCRANKQQRYRGP